MGKAHGASVQPMQSALDMTEEAAPKAPTAKQAKQAKQAQEFEELAIARRRSFEKVQDTLQEQEKAAKSSKPKAKKVEAR
mmetsp:Transcript_49225/g.129462  ORF Transcript_49225/g.129462 Transcript_49225/m.129462 type:complete len:80 (+) Transcript_49225:364-603(+)